MQAAKGIDNDESGIANPVRVLAALYKNPGLAHWQADVEVLEIILGTLNRGSYMTGCAVKESCKCTSMPTTRPTCKRGAQGREESSCWDPQRFRGFRGCRRYLQTLFTEAKYMGLNGNCE